MVITDYGPPSNSNVGGNDRPFYLWKKENPPGKESRDTIFGVDACQR